MTAAAAGILAASISPAAADPVAAAKDLGGGGLYNAGHAVFVVKDLGGGVYFNATTGTLYVVTTAVDTVAMVGTAGESLVATSMDDGRDALLLVNGTVLVPVQRTLAAPPG